MTMSSIQTAQFRNNVDKTVEFIVLNILPLGTFNWGISRLRYHDHTLMPMLDTYHSIRSTASLDALAQSAIFQK